MFGFLSLLDCLFLSVQLTTIQHWFRYCLDTKQATNQIPKPMMTQSTDAYMCHLASILWPEQNYGWHCCWTFSDGFSWKKLDAFWFKFHWNYSLSEGPIDNKPSRKKAFRNSFDNWFFVIKALHACIKLSTLKERYTHACLFGKIEAANTDSISYQCCTTSVIFCEPMKWWYVMSPKYLR